ncbi:hypothetical protein PMIN06_004130 [Paraphaeosphaeria minitans]
MIKLLMFTIPSLLMAVAGASSCWGSFDNCTVHAMNLHSRGMSAIEGIVEGPPRVPWPDGKVTYCYADYNTRNALKRTVEGAIQLWMSALGGPASAETGHSLSFKELKSDRNWPTYCYLYTYMDFDHTGDWNPVVPPDTLALHRSVGTSSGASVGYQPGPAGANNILLGLGPSLETMWPILGHEFGHVLGFGHEHQRDDRDKHILFNCDKVLGYQQSLAKLMTSGRPLSQQLAHDLLCNDWRTALSIGSTLNAFVYWPTQRMFGSFDKDSIMHYGSEGFSDKRLCTPSTPSGCPITTLNGEYIWPKMKVSAGDAQAAREMYPWREPALPGPARAIHFRS